MPRLRRCSLRRLPRPARPPRLACRGPASGGALRPVRLPGGGAARPRAPAASRGSCLPRERRARSGSARLALQRTADSARPPAGRAAGLAPLREVALRLAARPRGRLPASGRWQLHSRAARLRQADRDGLLRRTRAVLALPNVVHLLAHELASLRRRRLALRGVFLRAVDGLLVGHVTSSFAATMRPPAQVCTPLRCRAPCRSSKRCARPSGGRSRTSRTDPSA